MPTRPPAVATDCLDLDFGIASPGDALVAKRPDVCG
jgi:hypothetical protein